MRPSITSVTPYDDNADTLISKVENINKLISLRKKSSSKKSGYLNKQNEGEFATENALKNLEISNDKLMNTKKVVANNGK
jgi:hypothetical protein